MMVLGTHMVVLGTHMVVLGMVVLRNLDFVFRILRKSGYQPGFNIRAPILRRN